MTKEKKQKHSLVFKIGIPLFVIFLIGGIVFLYLGLNPPRPSIPGRPRQVCYTYETFEEMQKAVNNMEYKQEDYYFQLDFDDVVVWEYKMTAIDYCGEKAHPKEERCNKLRDRRFTIEGSYDGGFTGQNKCFGISFYYRPKKDSPLHWTATPREPIDKDTKYESTSFSLRDENNQHILGIGFCNISEEEISVFIQKIEELVYKNIE